jgi:hypothetical protein
MSLPYPKSEAGSRVPVVITDGFSFPGASQPNKGGTAGNALARPLQGRAFFILRCAPDHALRTGEKGVVYVGR